MPDPEVSEKPKRRRFSPEYKLRVLREADSCKNPGEIGALLRREGLYSSHLTAWRKQRDEGALKALTRARGRKKPNPLEAENAKLRRRAERAETELVKARKVIEVQGNVSALLDELLRDGVEVRSGPQPRAAVVEKLGLHLVRLLDEDSPASETFLKVITPSGKTGYVQADAVRDLVEPQMCFIKDVGGWKIAGYFGGDPNSN